MSKTSPFNVLAITLLIQAMVVASALAPAAIAPAITSALGLPVSAIGIFVAIVYLSAVCAALYSGTLISKWGPIRTSQIGLVSCALGAALVASGVTILGMLGAMLIGFGYGPITPASSDLLIRTTPQHRLSTVFSIKQTGVPLGGVIVGLAVPSLEIAFGWRWAILSVSVGCIAMVLLAQLLRGALDTGRPTYSTQSFVASVLNPVRLVLSHPGLKVLAGCSFVFAGVQLSLSANLSTYLHLELGWSLLAAGVAMSAVQVAGIAGRIVWGAISDRGLGPHRSLALLAVAMAAGCVATSLFTRDTDRLWVFAVLIVFGASAVGWNGVYLAEVARLAPPGKAGIATGGTLAFTFLGIVFWTPIFGLIADTSGGYDIAYLLFCLPLMVCLWFFLKERPTVA